MKVEPFLLASTLRAVIAQRLVRRLCPHCRMAEKADEPSARLIGAKAGVTIWRPHGCAHCADTGYIGRVGLYEVQHSLPYLTAGAACLLLLFYAARALRTPEQDAQVWSDPEV